MWRVPGVQAILGLYPKARAGFSKVSEAVRNPANTSIQREQSLHHWAVYRVSASTWAFMTMRD